MIRSTAPMVGELMALYRRVTQINIRTLSAEIGVSAATLSRIENGKPMDSATMLKVMRWLFEETQ